mmetsp:Transcript_43052/g.136854  ORF Transcript_43052/g.136854 Transcript_43052/m.136854 type:complete len:201 (+) Transcript_43052:152-754(+)
MTSSLSLKAPPSSSLQLPLSPSWGPSPRPSPGSLPELPGESNVGGPKSQSSEAAPSSSCASVSESELAPTPQRRRQKGKATMSGSNRRSRSLRRTSCSRPLRKRSCGACADGVQNLTVGSMPPVAKQRSLGCGAIALTTCVSPRRPTEAKPQVWVSHMNKQPSSDPLATSSPLSSKYVTSLIVRRLLCPTNSPNVEHPID